MELITVENFNKDRIHKRRRVVKLCSNCRERKVKCDFTRPICKVCEEKQLSNCHYSKFTNTVDLTHMDRESQLLRENKRLKQQIEQLQSLKEVPDNSPRIDVKKFQQMLIKNNRTVYFGLTCWRSSFDMDQGVGQMKKWMKNSRSDWKLFNRLSAIADIADHELLTSIENQLPNYGIISDYLERFFDGLWGQLLPIVDKDCTFKKLQQLFHSDQDRIKLELNSEAVNYAHCALILTILKIMANSELDEPDCTERLFKDDFDLILRYVDKLLQRAMYLQKVTLPSLQTVFLLRVLKRFNYKDSDGGDGSNGSLLLALCFQMAITLGLHQDVDWLYRSQSVEFRKILKNLWVRILFYDAIHAFELGVPLHISDSDFKPDLLDNNDVMVKTIMRMRAYITMFLSSCITLNTLKRELANCKEFLTLNFIPVFQMIEQFQHAGPHESTEILIKFSLLNTIIIMTQYIYHFLHINSIKNDEEHITRYYNLSLKYCILSEVSGVEFQRVVHSSRTHNPFWKEQKCFASGISREGSGMYFYNLLKPFNSAKYGLKNKTKVEHRNVVFKVSELQDFSTDDDPIYDDPYRAECGLRLSNKMINRSVSTVLFTKTNSHEVDSSKLLSNISDYGFFMTLLLMNHLNLIERESYSETSEFVSYEVVYDVLPDISHANSLTPVSLFDELEWPQELELMSGGYFEHYFTDISESVSSFLESI